MENIEKYSGNSTLIFTEEEFEEHQALIDKIFSQRGMQARIGWYIHADYSYGRITGFELVPLEEENEHFPDGYRVRVHFEKFGEKEDYRNQSKFFHEMKYYDYKFHPEPREFFIAEAEKVLAGKSSLKDYSKPEKQEPGLIHFDQGVLVSQRDKMILQSNTLDLIRRTSEELLKSKMDEFQTLAKDLRSKMHKINQVLKTLELYLGINESFKTIIEGVPAPADTPIAFRQKILFMDEEVGDPTDGGLDFNSMKDFYSWLDQYSEYWKKKNFETILPETKCVVALQIRRKDKDYKCENPFINKMINLNNKETFFLIRNGEQVHAVHADIRVYPKLFPGKEEFLKAQKEIHETDPDSWDFERKKEELLADAFRYQMQILVLQGLLTRTQAFHPIAQPINLISEEVFSHPLVNFVEDDHSKMLADQKMKFKEWQKKLNQGIQEGSRIFLGWAPGLRDEYDNRYRLPFYNGNLEHVWFNQPDQGVYIVEERELQEWKESKQILTIKYIPEDDDIYDEWEGRWRSRKYAITYRISRDDGFLINYDAVTAEDLDRLWHMLHSRENRTEYFSLVPLILGLRKAKQEELDREKQFLELVKNYADFEFTDQAGLEAIRWWKLKNKWRRSLEDDDDKAFRMILRRLKK